MTRVVRRIGLTGAILMAGLAGPSVASAAFTIPKGYEAAISGAAVVGCNAETGGYRLNGGSFNFLVSKPAGCPTGSPTPVGFTILPATTSRALLLSLSDGSCAGAEYLSDGTPVNHALVTGPTGGPYTVSINDAGSSCTLQTTANPPATAGSGNFNATVTIRPAPPQVTVTVPSPPASQDGQFNINDLSAGGGGIPVTVSAVDLTGVAGAATISCTDNGTPLPVTGVSTSGSTTTGTVKPSQNGSNVITCNASVPNSRVGTTGAANVALLEINSVAPTLDLPASPFAMPAISAAGLPFAAYPVSASDPDGTSSVACTPAPPVTLPVGDTTVSCVASDSAGNRTTGSFVVRVLPPPPPPPPGGTTPPPHKPRLSSVKESARKWRTSDKLPRIARTTKHRLPIGTRFTFKLDRTARVKLSFVRLGKHRKAMGSLSFNGHRGTNSVAFYGRLSKRSKKPFGTGFYDVTISAANAAGASTADLQFIIV